MVKVAFGNVWSSISISMGCLHLCYNQGQMLTFCKWQTSQDTVYCEVNVHAYFSKVKISVAFQVFAYWTFIYNIQNLHLAKISHCMLHFTVSVHILIHVRGNCLQGLLINMVSRRSIDGSMKRLHSLCIYIGSRTARGRGGFLLPQILA